MLLRVVFCFQPSGRKQHNVSYKHKANVKTYYQQFEEQQTQSLIDQRIKEHLGQTVVFQQVRVAYNQHLLAQRPRLPILPTPIMPTPGAALILVTAPLTPGIRPPVLLRPFPGAPGYVPGSATSPMVAPPGAPSLSCQVNGILRPLTIMAPPTVPGSTAAPTPSGTSPMVPPANYQPNPAAPTSGGFDSFNSNAPAPEANH